MNKVLTFKFESAEEGGYVCQILEIPEVISQGETLKDAALNLIDAYELVMDYQKETQPKFIVASEEEVQKVLDRALKEYGPVLEELAKR